MSRLGPRSSPAQSRSSCRRRVWRYRGGANRLCSLISAVVAVALVALVLNAMSRSSGERRIWVPVTVVMLSSSLTVALAAV